MSFALCSFGPLQQCSCADLAVVSMAEEAMARHGTGVPRTAIACHSGAPLS
eukprot:CAMPEP_0115320854 /NCGR_PEP_ID=MMETSP0270-20121206/80548_1 /TAXON_ID=71861 /ORGANISM="Scrippsiella trochoidea, Strain CCMP3099" /LENGTH=50 /DNA_ID=CAMNT_0002740695 /DNA_START=84 /DNA_END=233 /DNA_ORIENTATION=+